MQKHRGLVAFMAGALLLAPFVVSAATFSRPLDLGSTGPDVQSLQQVLKDKGFFPSDFLTTTYYGIMTRDAVAKYQASVGISAVGSVGPLTLAALNGSSTVSTNPQALLASLISELQTLLKAAGLYSGPITGVLDAPTIAAVSSISSTTTPATTSSGSGGSHHSSGGGDTTPTPDTTAPAISAVAAAPTSGDGTQAVITWTTDEAANSQVAYGTSAGTYTGSSTPDATLATSHSVTLTGLTASTTYYFIVRSADAASNLASSTEQSFASAIPLSSLPLANGAKVAALGHSFIQRGGFSRYLSSQTATNGLQGYQVSNRGVLNIASAEDGRFNADVFADATNPYAAPSTQAALSGSYQGLAGDHLYALSGAPGTINRTPYVLARNPQIVYIDIGTNDINSGVGGPFGTSTAAADVISALDTQVNLLTRSGVWVILQTLAFRRDWYDADPSDPRIATLQAVNTWIEAQVGRAGVKVADTVSIDGTSSVTKAALPNTAGNLEIDGIHPTTLLSEQRAAVLLPIIQSMVTAGDPRNLNPLSGNLFPEAGLTGTTGTKVSTAPSFTASVSSTTMTVTAIGGNGVILGATLTGSGVAASTTVVSQLTSTESTSFTGGRGTYQVSVAQDLTSRTLGQTVSSATVSGIVAASTTLTRVTGTSGIAASKHTVSAGNEQQVLTITPVNDGIAIHGARITFPDIILASTTLAEGDWVEAYLPVQLDDWSGWDFYSNSGTSPVGFANELYTSGNTLVWQGVDSSTARNGSFVLHAKFQIPTGVSVNKLRYSSRPIQISWLSTASGTGTVTIGSPILREISDPSTVWNLTNGNSP